VTGLVEVVVETPRGSRNVYEVDDAGRVYFDRRLPGSFAYPADYGYIAAPWAPMVSRWMRWC
jgi:inorganic pyrophosphatase